MENEISQVKKIFQSFLDKKKLAIPALLFIFVFSVFLYTSPRYQTGYADSEELMAAAYTLGIPHPPGYPLFVVFSRPFIFLPFGTTAFRFSIFSSFFGALTCVLVYLTILKILGYESRSTNHELRIKNTYFIIPALAGALCLAFSYNFWLYSIVPEVFCVANFFVILLIFILISWHKEKQKLQEKYHVFLFSFCFGLAFLSQQIIVLFIPAFLYLIWKIDKKLFIPSKKWIIIFLGLILGLSFLIYFPWAAKKKPQIDYGNPTNLERLINLIFRKAYGKGDGLFSAYIPGEINIKEKIQISFQYFPFLVEQFTPILIYFGLIGVIFLFQKKYRQIGIFLLLALFFSGPFFSFWSWAEIKDLRYIHLGGQERMVLSSFVVFSLFIGIGVFYSLKILRKRNLSFKAISLILFLLLALPVFPFFDNFSAVSKRNFVLGKDFAENLFLNIEKDAIFFVRGDRPTFAAFYYQLVEKKRQDVTVLSFGSSSWNIDRLKEKEPYLFDTKTRTTLAVIRDIIQENIYKRPIYITAVEREEQIQLGLSGNPFLMSPKGIIFKITKDFETGEGFFEKLVWNSPKTIDSYYDWYSKALIEQYLIGLSNNFHTYYGFGYYDLAEKELKKLIEIAPIHYMTQKAIYSFSNIKEKESMPKMFTLATPEKHIEQANFYLEQEKAAEAMSEYWTAVYIEPSNNIYRFQLAWLYEILGWDYEAIEQYDFILKTETENKELLEKTKQRLELLK